MRGFLLETTMTETALSQPEQTAVDSLALITIDPAQYVAAVFAPFRTDLEAAKVAADAATFDITTTAGMKVATEQRAVFRDLRVSAEKARVERKAPILQIGRLLDSSYKTLEEEITPFEERFDKAIKAEDKRKADEKAERERLARERIEAIRKRISEIREAPVRSIGVGSVDIKQLISTITAVEIDGSFGEFADEAALAKQEALEKLELALVAAEQQEAERARLEAQRLELERQEAEARKQREAEAAKLAEERRQLDAQRAEQERLARAQAPAAPQAEQKQPPNDAPVQQKVAAPPPPAPVRPPVQKTPPVLQPAPEPLEVLALFVKAYEGNDPTALAEAHRQAIRVLAHEGRVAA